MNEKKERQCAAAQCFQTPPPILDLEYYCCVHYNDKTVRQVSPSTFTVIKPNSSARVETKSHSDVLRKVLLMVPASIPNIVIVLTCDYYHTGPENVVFQF